MSETSRQLIGIFNATTALKKDTGVDDPEVKPGEIRKVGMLGGGLMGGGICYVTMQNANIPVRLKEINLEGLARGYKYINDIYNERQKKRQITKYERLRKSALFTGSVEYVGFGDVDVMIEAVFEDLDLKHKVLKQVEEVCGPKTIFASNTSSIPITKIAAAAQRPRAGGRHALLQPGSQDASARGHHHQADSRLGDRYSRGTRQEAGQDRHRGQRWCWLLHQPNPRTADERGGLHPGRRRSDRTDRWCDESAGAGPSARSPCSTKWASISLPTWVRSWSRRLAIA